MATLPHLTVEQAVICLAVALKERAEEMAKGEWVFPHSQAITIKHWPDMPIEPDTIKAWRVTGVLYGGFWGMHDLTPTLIEYDADEASHEWNATIKGKGEKRSARVSLVPIMDEDWVAIERAINNFLDHRFPYVWADDDNAEDNSQGDEEEKEDWLEHRFPDLFVYPEDQDD